MLWRHASFGPQRPKPRGGAAISVIRKGNDGAAVSHRFDRDMGGCRS